MAFMSIDEPEFWGHLSKKMGHVVGGGLSGVSTFILGNKKENPPTADAAGAKTDRSKMSVADMLAAARSEKTGGGAASRGDGRGWCR